jgi:hypothetical protein
VRHAWAKERSFSKYAIREIIKDNNNFAILTEKPFSERKAKGGVSPFSRGIQ